MPLAEKPAVALTESRSPAARAGRRALLRYPLASCSKAAIPRVTHPPAHPLTHPLTRS